MGQTALSAAPTRRKSEIPTPQVQAQEAQGAQSAIRNSLKARQCCNPPQSAIRHAEHVKSLQAFASGTAG
eukprot:15476976-Alexandrium_andersonii.AAC.1